MDVRWLIAIGLRIFVAGTVLPLASIPVPTAFIEPDQVVITDAFHIVGIPTVKRNGRVDVQFGPNGLRFTHDQKEVLLVQYSRVTRMQILQGNRTYAKATYAAVLAVGLPGLFVLNKKNPVDTLVIDYVNERGGQMGLVVQVPLGKGGECREQLEHHQVTVEEPMPLTETPAESKPQ